jgi:hypothetical protein
MQIKQIALAVATTLAAASSFAADVDHTLTPNATYSTGASAQQPDFTAALGAMCTAANGTLHAFKATANNNGNLENVLTLACQDSTGASKAFNGTTIDTVYQNVSGGSLTSVLNPLLNTSTTFVDAASTTCAVGTTVGSGAVLPVGTVVHIGCGTLTSQAEGGFSDTEVTIAQGYLDSKLSPAGKSLATITTKSAGLLQAFGVAVSDDLYVALYKAQVGTIIPAALCPATTASNADIVAAGYGGTVGTTTYVPNTLCQPSVSRAEMASVMAGTSMVKNNGTLVFNGLASNKLTYCRRPVTSGTQQTAQNYFLLSPAGVVPLTVIGSDFLELTNPASKIESFSNGVKFAVFVGSGTGNTTDCLGGRNADVGYTATTVGTVGAVAAGPQYRIGIVSAEKRPNVAFASPVASPAAQGNYKFVRLSEVPVTEGGTTSTTTFTAKNGRYDLIVESRVNYESGGATSAASQTLFDQVIANISGSTYPGLFKIDTTATTARSFNHDSSDSRKAVVR